MTTHDESLLFLDKIIPQGLHLLKEWVAINSWSENLEGLNTMANALDQAFAGLGGTRERFRPSSRQMIGHGGKSLEREHGEIIHLRKRPQAPRQILLVGHMDTVYPPSDREEKVEELPNGLWKGPGIADMKGGIAILLLALQTLEQSPLAEEIGWEVFLTPDEEIGSHGSAPFLKAAAERCQIGLIFEPAFADGSIVNCRKGSGNFTAIARGKSAHAGRDFYAGRNAIISLAKLIVGIETLNDRSRGITYNVGNIEGGGPVNIVPDFAMCRINVRMNEPQHMAVVRESLQNMAKGLHSPDGIIVELHETGSHLPKPLDPATAECFEKLHACASQLGMDLKFCMSGGVCDGNDLAAAGLPTIDALGVVGGYLHTAEEYMLLSSFRERARLATALILDIAKSPPFTKKVK